MSKGRPGRKGLARLLEKGPRALVLLAMVVTGTAWVLRYLGAPRDLANAWTGGLPYQEAGRDLALIQGIRMAKVSIILKTEMMTLVPVADELGQAAQRGVLVKVHMPREARTALGPLLPALVRVGVQVYLDPEGFQGTLLTLDGRSALYSALPVVASKPGAKVGFVGTPKGGVQ